MIDDLVMLVILALTVACISWTVTREELFREPREWLEECSRTASSWVLRKLCYMATCEYCFSHYVAAFMIALADFSLLLPGWRGYVLAWFSVVAFANVFMSAYARLRVEIHKSRAEFRQLEKQDQQENNEPRRWSV
jgi:hypothetical protein